MSFPLIFSVSTRVARWRFGCASLRSHSLSSLRGFGCMIVLLVAVVPSSAKSAEQTIRGHVRDAEGAPIAAAMVSLSQGTPFHERSVFSDHAGAYQSTLKAGEAFAVRVRRIGWRDLGHADVAPLSEEAAASYDFSLERETDAAALAAQLPANRWFSLLLQEIDDDVQREEFVRQCTYCHQ